MFFSLIIPVFNRPHEVQELLESLRQQTYHRDFEIVIVEDGSSSRCEHIIELYADLNISYYPKPNSGPGDSRNFGMRKAKGNYFLIFDSDCIIPPQYLDVVNAALQEQYVDCFGGPDAALDTFSDIQKAINFAMTSFLTTGGIRGGSERLTRFQPRSFNMGISKAAFETSGGFSDIHPGEDPDLSIRLWKAGYETRLIPQAYVYHKRRIDWKKFYTQVSKFGKARPILNKWHPEFAKPTFLLPTLFMIGFAIALLLLAFDVQLLLILYALYFLLVFVAAAVSSGSIHSAILSVIAVAIQFYGYGYGFLKSYIQIKLLNRKPQDVFPELFFKK